MAERDPPRNIAVDAATAELAQQLAAALGVSLAEAVHAALADSLAAKVPAPASAPKRRPAVEILEELWRDFPPSRGGVASTDKAFFDELSGEL
ncbi:MAG: hypothetical protein A4S16_10720 [Proteobacteria bacterium SG_bin6]|nr:MAG: hypothetical protein A4S16_10720 [Proteobacteria bacterium SG_bin6]